MAKQGSALVPSSLGRVVSAFLEAYFRTYVDYAFTSGLEQQLDEVSAGRAQWKDVLAGFWGPFQGVVQGMAGISVTQVSGAAAGMRYAHSSSWCLVAVRGVCISR